MIDKQIIIDRVNVKECKYYCNGKCERYEEFVEADYANYSVKCICEKENDLGTYDICDYQQLKRKEQECNRLKEEVSLLKESNSKLQQIEDVNSLEKCYLQQIDQLKAENEKLKNTIMQKCPQCGEVYLNPIGCELYEQIDQLKAKNKELEEANDEKNELLAQLGCPTIATARRLALTLKEQVKAKEEEGDRLKEYIKHLHNLCGNETDKQYKYKQTLIEVKDFVENEMIPNGDTYIILQKISEVLE